MEEKLRNLSQNIANNTGPREAENHEEIHEENHEENHEETPVEEIQEQIDEQNANEEHEEGENEVSDYAPEPEEGEEHHEEEHHEEETPEEEHHEESEENHEEHEENHEEAPEEKPEEETEVPVEKAEEHSNAETIEVTHEEPMILSMEDEGTSEPVSDAPKYSPEVEAALNRLNNQEYSEEVAEPLSTEPAPKRHHGFRNFLLILFILAIGAVTVCILVEKDIIDNPFPTLFGKSKQEEKTEPEKKTEEEPAETQLTDEKLLAEVDALFLENHKDSTVFYVYSKTYQKTSEGEFIYYNVAEPGQELNANLTDCAEATDCLVAVESITAENYQNFPHYRYIFKKSEFGPYEFKEKQPVIESKEVENLVNTSEEGTK